MYRIKRQMKSTTNPRKIPATAVTTTSFDPASEDSAPGLKMPRARSSLQLQPFTVQH